jgi:hypothetical protein
VDRKFAKNVRETLPVEEILFSAMRAACAASPTCAPFGLVAAASPDKNRRKESGHAASAEKILQPDPAAAVAGTKPRKNRLAAALGHPKPRKNRLAAALARNRISQTTPGRAAPTPPKSQNRSRPRCPQGFGEYV